MKTTRRGREDDDDDKTGASTASTRAADARCRAAARARAHRLCARAQRALTQPSVRTGPCSSRTAAATPDGVTTASDGRTTEAVDVEDQILGVLVLSKFFQD